MENRNYKVYNFVSKDNNNFMENDWLPRPAGTSIRLGLETIYQTTAEVYFLRYQNYMKYILLRTSCQKV